MIDQKQLEELAKKLYSSLPASLQNFEKEIQQKFKEILQTTFARLDLITREEFDIQTKVLARTREKVEMLETQIKTLINDHEKVAPNQSKKN
ncbi:Uncharacterized protein conserved in bacteria (plasmid) [Legionella adelaidensis]|uniref:Ubiquinone biosynthesis accessory factor UbiK n=1 Tax=Legionella adelaidensis TaxID=45056 RepID=A0A0W0R639_9GAMM|nr:accessory factor UbiK family protein [Legionella adelaidensis]KTC66550.1 Membrane fusogenic activity [Legionella adelaidensis]VEH81179.1 Uncharacterized protein conserved in bacteria [Legionella adelaidensis]